MGTHCSSELNRGHISKSKTAIMKFLSLTVFVAVAIATEENDKQAAGLGYYGYPYKGYYGSYSHGKPISGEWIDGYGYAIPNSGNSDNHRTQGKRSAEEEAYKESKPSAYAEEAKPSVEAEPHSGYSYGYGAGYGYGPS